MSGGHGGTRSQVWLPELGMYYYKARMYSPTLGRFMQTDPIGYEDQVNLYGYVGNDPINAIDPTGLETHNCDGTTQPDGPQGPEIIVCDKPPPPPPSPSGWGLLLAINRPAGGPDKPDVRKNLCVLGSGLEEAGDAATDLGLGIGAAGVVIAPAISLGGQVASAGGVLAASGQLLQDLSIASDLGDVGTALVRAGVGAPTGRVIDRAAERLGVAGQYIDESIATLRGEAVQRYYESLFSLHPEISEFIDPNTQCE